MKIGTIGDAVARLIMESGSVVSDAEIADVLSSYGYIEDGLTPNRYDHQVEEGCGVELSADFETVDVFGESKDHLNNINYMLQRFGWIDCKLLSVSRDIEHVLLARLVNVSITTNEIVADLSGAAPSAVNSHPSSGPEEPDELVIEYTPPTRAEQEPAARIDDVPQPFIPEVRNAGSVDIDGDAPEAIAIAALERDHLRIQELTIENEAMRQDRDRLEDENTVIRRQLAQAEQQLIVARSAEAHGAGTAVDAGDSGLRRFVEKYVVNLASINASLDPALVEDLSSIGYGVEVKLVRL
jgi:hypothetical protein